LPCLNTAPHICKRIGADEIFIDGLLIIESTAGRSLISILAFYYWKKWKKAAVNWCEGMMHLGRHNLSTLCDLIADPSSASHA